MNDKKPDYDGRFPGVEPIPEPDHPDHAATDMLDEVVTGIMENKDDEELRRPAAPSKNNSPTDQTDRSQ
ncbi:hypothetical protein [Paenibacillus dakarensis]|uniref:hypothetical protein n=1 Tax=Paenibacillus dakarensis TaxID=1527293 RepID=UPI0006D56BB6|nr:hypothetical protein [Paenibacillus dakarensis]